LVEVSDIEKDKTLYYLDKNKLKKNCVITYIKINEERKIQLGTHQYISLKDGNSVIIFKESWRDDMAVRFKNYNELEDLMYSIQNKTILNIPDLFSIQGDEYQAYFLDKPIEDLKVEDLVNLIFNSQYKSAELDKDKYIDKDKIFNDIPLYESKNIEFKQEIPKNVRDIAKILTSFANTDGGSLYIGVDDDRFIIGIDDVDKIQLRINGIARNVCEPSLHPKYNIINFDGKKVLKVDIEKSDKVHRVNDGKFYVRIGPASLEISADELEKLILDRYRNRKGSLE